MRIGKSVVAMCFMLTMAMFGALTSTAQAESNFFTTQGCSGCHVSPVTATCNGCHAHGTHPNSAKNAINVTGSTNKSSYAPGETVTVTINGGYRVGWIRVVLLDQNSVELARSNGNASGMGSSATYPATLSAPAPATPGTYSWKVGWYGNKFDMGGATFGSGWVADSTNPNHGYEIVSISAPFTVTAPPVSDTTAPVITAFALPGSATSLTIPVTSLIATDNVAVTGYLITTSATPPAAGDTGWSATVPATVTAPAAGSVTFHAWAKDAAGNVSVAATATVMITLPTADTTPPVVTAFILPGTATSMTIPVTSLIATDNVAVTGYLITTSATPPAAGDSGWSATVPATVTAPAAGSVTFHAWAKDAAGNVSASANATVVITIDNSAFGLKVSTLADGSYTKDATLNISGTVTGSQALKLLTINKKKITVAADGSFSYAIKLKKGPNSIVIVAIDSKDNKKSDTRVITYDPFAPHIQVTAPADNSKTTATFVSVTGSVDESATVTASVNNGSPHTATMTGNAFSVTVNLAAGVNTINITATDLAGNSAHAKRTITSVTGATPPTLEITEPAQDITTNQNHIDIQGTVSSTAGKVSVTVTVDDHTYKVKVNEGQFHQKITFKTPKQYAIVVTATDESGVSTTVQRNVIYQKSTDGDKD